MILPENAQSNLFRAGNYAQVAYRLFVTMTPNQDKQLLMRAQHSILKADDGALVFLRGSELWAFSLKSTPPPQLSDFPGLTETSTGLFLPSTLGSSDAALHIPAYNALVSAIRELVFRCIMRTTVCVHFGVSSVIANNHLIHVDPILTSTGDLFLKSYYESTSLRTLNKNERTKLANQKVFLAPSATVAEFLAPCNQPSNIAQFNFLVQATTLGFSARAKDLKFKDWARVKLELGRVVIWPLDLIYWRPSTRSAAPSEFEWFDNFDTMTSAEEQASQVKEAVDSHARGVANSLAQNHLINTTNASANTQNPTHPERLYPQQQNRPQPNVQNQQQNQNQNQNQQHQQQQQQLQAASATVYPTPPDPQLAQYKRPDTEANSWDMTPSMNNEDWGDAMEDDDLFGGDEVTDADFNFFDKPEPEESAPKDEVMLDADSETATKTEASKDDKVPEKEQEMPVVKEEVVDFTAETMRPLGINGTGMFAPLKFDPLITSYLDAKYKAGGRYHVSDPEDADTNESSSDSESDTADGAAPHANKELTEKVSSPVSSPKKEESSELDYSADWINILLSSANEVSESIEINAIDTPSQAGLTNYDHYVNAMIQQVVWDDGALADFAPVNNTYRAPDSSLIRQLSESLNPLRRLTLRDIMNYSDDQAVSPNTDPHPPPLSQISTPNLEAESRLDIASATPSKSMEEKVLSAAQEETQQIESASATQPTLATTTNVYHQQTPSVNAHPQQFSMEAQRKITSSVFQIDVPFYSVLRGENKLKARAPILNFWRPFGISPQHGAKRAEATMLVPSGLAKSSSSKAFMESLCNMYEGCQLGEMTLTPQSETPGIVGYSASQHTVESAIEGLRQAANEFATSWLERCNAKNLVLIVVTPFNQVSALLAISHIFYDLKDMISETNPSVNLELQVLRADDLAIKNSFTVPSQYRISRLCLRLYDKFVTDDVDEEFPLYVQRMQPSFSISRLPSKIQLKFQPAPSKSLMDEDTLMHVAYSISRDKRWLCVAWTDQWGEMSKVEAFVLRRAGSRPRAYEQVFSEVWDKTLTLMNRIPVKWRVALAKIGAMTAEESNIWTLLAEGSSNKVNFSYFLSINVSPSILLTGDSALFPHGKYQNKPNNKRQKYDNGTPITPQRAEDSPDTYSITSGGTAGSGETEKEHEDSTIVDVMDVTYGIIMQGQIGNIGSTSSNQTILKPLICGYLLKPAVQGQMEQRLLEASLVHCPTSYDRSMRSLLQHYRRLASLGGYSGVSEATHSILPWHIQACEKIQNVLAYID